MKKLKTLGAISFALIGGGALVSIPLAITSCKKNGDNFGNDSLKKQKITVNWNTEQLTAKTPAQWTTGFICGTIDATDYKNKDFKFGGLIGTAYAFARGLESWTFEAGVYGKFTAGADLSEITITARSTPHEADYLIKLEYELFYTDKNDQPHVIADNVVGILDVYITE